MRARTHSHMCVPAHVHARTRTHMHARIRKRKHANTHARKGAAKENGQNRFDAPTKVGLAHEVRSLGEQKDRANKVKGKKNGGGKRGKRKEAKDCSPPGLLFGTKR